MVEDRDDARGVGAPGGAEPAPGSVPVAGVGHGAGDGRARATPACPGDHPAIVRAAEWLLGEEVTRARRLVGRAAGPRARAAGRSSSPTSTTPTSTTPPRSCSRCVRRSERPRTVTGDGAPIGAGSCGDAAAIDGDRPCAALGRGHAELRRRLGRVRRRQHPRARARAPVPGLRRGDRRAERRRDRARGRDARRARAAPTRPPRGAGVRWLLDQPGGRRAPGSGAGASTTSTAPAPLCRRWSPPASTPRDAVHPRAPCAGSSATRTRTAAGARTRAPTTIRAWIGRGPSTASQTAWALLALHAAGRALGEALERGRGLARGTPAARRRLGRAAVHRHRLPVRLLHQLPPLPAHLPGDGARPLPGAVAGAGRRGWSPTASAHRRAVRSSRSPRGSVRASRAAMLAAEARRRAHRGGRDGAGRERELPGRQPRCCRGASRSHLLAVYGFARLVDELGDSLAGRSPRRAGLARGGARPGLRRARRAPAARSPAADAARVRAAARAVRAPDRGQPRRPARRAAIRPGSSCAATARCRPTPSASSCSASSGGRRPRRIALSDSICTGAAARRALPGRGRGPRRRARLPAAGGPRPLRLPARDLLGASMPVRRCAEVLAFEVARARGPAVARARR